MADDYPFGKNYNEEEMDDVAPETASIEQSMAIFVELGIQKCNSYPDIDIDPHPSSGGVHGHQWEFFINRVEEDVSGILIVVWSTDGIAEVERDEDEWHDDRGRQLISLFQLLLQVYLIDNSLHQEDEIVIQLRDESVDRVGVLSIFEIVEGDTSCETDDLIYEGVVSEIWELDQVVGGECDCKDTDRWKLPCIGCFVTKKENVNIRIDRKNDSLWNDELKIWNAKWLLLVSTLSPREDRVNHKAIEVES